MIFHLHFSNLKDKDRKIKTYEPRKEIIFQILIQILVKKFGNESRIRKIRGKSGAHKLIAQ